MTGIFLLAVMLFPVPALIGVLATGRIHQDTDTFRQKLPLFWVSGQMLLWAVFQLITVPLVLLEKPFSTDFTEALSEENPLWTVVTLFGAAILLLTVTAVWLLVRNYAANKGQAHKSLAGVGKAHTERNAWSRILWYLFWVLLLLQLILAVFMTYADGDDAFYVTVSTITEESNTMYRKLPYTGGTTILDGRHGLAPFPVWIAFLARLSGIPAVTVAHVAAPLALIPMTYAIYGLICQKLCKGEEEKLPLFLVLTELLVIFGDTSFSTVENFMIARSRQGKAALGSIVIPLALWIFLSILERIQEKRKIEWNWWLLLASAILTGCLCSTLGALLLCMFTGLAGVISAVCYRKISFLFPMACCCIPAVGYALIYLKLG